MVILQNHSTPHIFPLPEIWYKHKVHLNVLLNDFQDQKSSHHSQHQDEAEATECRHRVRTFVTSLFYESSFSDKESMNPGIF